MPSMSWAERLRCALANINLKTILESTGIPVAYHAFQDIELKDLPIIIYDEVSKRKFAADGIAYHVVRNYEIYLQEQYRNEQYENAIVDALTTAGIFVSEPSIEYSDDEKFYEITYEIEV